MKNAMKGKFLEFMRKTKPLGVKFMVVMFVLTMLGGLASCGEAKDSAAGLKDGVYSADSKVVDDHGGYGHVDLTVKDGKITECKYLTYLKDGKVKDEEYGKNLDKPLFEIAQKCNASCGEYAAALVEKQKIDQIDAVSGATFNHKIFVDAVKIALEGEPSE